MTPISRIMLPDWYFINLNRQYENYFTPMFTLAFLQLSAHEQSG